MKSIVAYSGMESIRAVLQCLLIALNLFAETSLNVICCMAVVCPSKLPEVVMDMLLSNVDGFKIDVNNIDGSKIVC